MSHHTDDAAPMTPQQTAGFQALFHQFLHNADTKIEWGKIQPPPADAVHGYASLSECPKDKIKEYLEQLVVLKLNGGLGTSMGCRGPKSVIEVRNELTFLDMIVRQIEYLNKSFGVNVPLVLMNSFNTHDETLKVVKKYESVNVSILTFNQNHYPRLVKDSLRLMPLEAAASESTEDRKFWYPPGHGDVYLSLKDSGMLDKLAAMKKKYIFVSNVDNLGASVDLNILHHIASTNREFCMEVTNKTRSDVKGGTLINYEGNLKLLEIAQVAKENVEEFKSIKKFKIFNTNNMWMSIDALQRVLKNKALTMEVIVNRKVVDGAQIIQLEQAAGAAIQSFDTSIGINVPRSRFLPVKNCSDLFVVQSNLYLMEHGHLLMNPAREFPEVPLVKLGGHFKKQHEYQGRFSTIPDILELDHLTVVGDVKFGAHCALKGTVIVVANHGARVDIPDGTILENKVVTGELHIIDH